MAVIDQVRSEINAAINTLTRRHGSTADAAEKAAIVQAIGELNDELTLLNQASLLQAASSLASASAVLEHAVAAARLGPFDGYLAALESHLTKFNLLSGKAHGVDSLERAVSAAPPGGGGPKGKKKNAKKANKKSAGKRTSRPAGVPAGLERASLESVAPPLLVSTTFADLRQEYQDLFDRCVLRPECAGNVDFYVKRLRQGQPNYQLVEQQIGVPWRFVGNIHGMECGFNFSAHLHNGDKLTARTVQVPKGRPVAGNPPFTWLESALDALRLRKLDQVTDWSLPHMLYLLEGYNGFGYRRRGLPTPYLWSFSSNYEKGKFVADGHFDADAVSKQCGAALMLQAVP
jgi:lysozyme family protein